MNRKRYIPPSIREIGLNNHLDATRSQHDDYDYSDFAKMRKSLVNKSDMARIFKVGRQTIDKWIDIYEEEINNKESTL